MPHQTLSKRVFAVAAAFGGWLMFCTIVATIPAHARADVEGIWYDDTGKGAVRIATCGSSGQSLCGYIVWLRNNSKPSGGPLTDELNPDPRNRNKQICGLQVIGRLKPQSDGSWDYGWIYDPKQGQSFDVALRPLSGDTLEITGYLGTKFLGKTFVWKRAPSNLATCGASAS